MERGQLWKGIAIGVGGTLLAALLIMVVSMTVIGASRDGVCPMCGAANEGRPDARRENGGMMGGGGMMGQGGMMDRMPDWMMSRGMGPEMMRDMRPIHELLRRHEQIQRQVEEIPGGVRTVTTSEDPEVVQAIRTHVRQMKARLEQGQPIRMMDPLFREIFAHHDQIEMQIDDVPGGVRVTETSEDPQVRALIRQHAQRAVSEFVERGMERAMEPTPLPPGYGARR